MNKPVKSRIRLLVKALRSGKYKQGRDALRTNDGFCCLGVACDIYRKETGKGRWRNNEFDGHKEYLPDRVVDWYGLDGHNPTAGDRYVSHMNDFGESFSAIADAFEEAYLK